MTGPFLTLARSAAKPQRKATIVGLVCAIPRRRLVDGWLGSGNAGDAKTGKARDGSPRVCYGHFSGYRREYGDTLSRGWYYDTWVPGYLVAKYLLRMLNLKLFIAADQYLSVAASAARPSQQRCNASLYSSGHSPLPPPPTRPNLVAASNNPPCLQ